MAPQGVLSWLGRKAANDAIFLCEDNPNYNDSSHPDSFKLGGVEYTRSSSIRKSVAEDRKKCSTVWRYGEALRRSTDNKEVFYCYICEKDKCQQKLSILNGTRGGLHHLSAVHSINTQGEYVEKRSADQRTIEGAQEYSQLVYKARFSEFKRLLITWIVYCQLAFTVVENRYFRELVALLNPAFSAVLPFAASTIRKWVLSEYYDFVVAIKKELAEALSSIHLSFDLWTSPGGSMAIMAVYAHYIDSRGRRRSQLLAFRRLLGEHTGHNQGALLLEVIKHFGFKDRVGYFIADNASSNDTAVEYVCKQLWPKMIAKRVRQRRLRCLGHIINLVARALLLGVGASKEIALLEVKIGKGAFEAVDLFWRGKGAVGKLHNLIRFVRSSPQRMEFFANIKIAGGGWRKNNLLKLVLNNATRWNSFYFMIQRAKDVEKRIVQFCARYPEKCSLEDAERLENDALTPAEWKQLDKVEDILKVFEVATMRTEGNKAWYSEWFMTLMWLMDTLDSHKQQLRKIKSKDKTYKYLSECCDHSWKKAEKYFKLVDQMPIAYAAIVLNPTMKLDWFKAVWNERGQSNYVDEVQALVTDIWQSDYKKHTSPRSTRLAAVDADSLHGDLWQYKRRKLTQDSFATPNIDALANYLATDCVPDTQQSPDDPPFNVLQYWLDRQLSQPELARFALDCLAIPNMSDNPERAFSAARDMITYRRTRLREDIIQACACLKSWYGPPTTKVHDTGEVEPAFDVESKIEDHYLQGNTAEELAKENEIAQVIEDNQGSDSEV